MSSIGSAVLSGSQSNTSSGGLGAGIPIATLVADSMANQTAELNLMQGQQQQITSESTALSAINVDLQNLQTAFNNLTNPAGVLTNLSLTSSNAGIVSGNAAVGSAQGTHTVVVNSLATTSSYYSDPVATGSTPIATGTLQIQVGTNAAVPITIDNTNNTLDGLAQTINSANTGVTASVINDASGARLAIVSNTSGAPGDLTVTPSSGEINFTKAVTGANASLTVDGIPISSSSNAITSAIPGVTLNLNSQSPGTPVTIGVAPDGTDAATAINSFVTSYNQLVTDLNAQFAVDPSTNTTGPLASDSTLSLVQSQILSGAAFSSTGNGNINSLSDLGVTLNNDGTLSVNSGTLASAVQNNPASVQAFFGSATSGSFGYNLNQVLNNLATPATGAVAVDMTGLTQQQTDLAQQISDFQNQMNVQEQQLTTQFNQVDVTLQELPLLLSQTQSQLASLG